MQKTLNGGLHPKELHSLALAFLSFKMKYMSRVRDIIMEFVFHVDDRKELTDFAQTQISGYERHLFTEEATYPAATADYLKAVQEHDRLTLLNKLTSAQRQELLACEIMKHFSAACANIARQLLQLQLPALAR